MNIKERISSIVINAAKTAFAQQLKEVELSDMIEVEIPNKKEHGDYSTNIAMRLARILRQAPLKTAESIAEQIRTTSDSSDDFERVDVLPPGFVNFVLSAGVLSDLMLEIAQEDTNYGRSAVAKGKKALVEFVSANPTGPLHIGHARNAILGDSISRLLEAVGYDVTREYYFNDAGVQMGKLGESLRARYLGLLGIDTEIPEGGYRGDYIIDIAKDMLDECGDIHKNTSDTKAFTDFAVKDILKGIDADLKDLGIAFDSWRTETSLHQSGTVDETIERLKALDKLYEQDGAWWLRSTEVGDEKDRVIIKSDGSKTYLAPDIAYHDDKFERGYDLMVNFFGADHHSYVDRLGAGIQFLGHDLSKLRNVIYQMVTLVKEGEKTKISTRSGEFITIHDMINEIGTDVIRFFFNMRSPDAHMVFDWELAKDTSMNNPVYYVQYAHARFCSLFKKAEELGIKWEGVENADLSLLKITEEKGIIKKMAELPSLVEASARNLEPHHLTIYARELAGLFHQFFTIGTKDPSYRILLPDNLPLTQARLSLIYTLRTVTRNTLTILGITAPQRM